MLMSKAAHVVDQIRSWQKFSTLKVHMHHKEEREPERWDRMGSRSEQTGQILVPLASGLHLQPYVPVPARGRSFLESLSDPERYSLTLTSLVDVWAKRPGPMHPHAIVHSCVSLHIVRN